MFQNSTENYPLLKRYFVYLLCVTCTFNFFKNSICLVPGTNIIRSKSEILFNDTFLEPHMCHNVAYTSVTFFADKL